MQNERYLPLQLELQTVIILGALFICGLNAVELTVMPHVAFEILHRYHYQHFPHTT